MYKFLDNDTFAIILLGIVAIVAVIKNESEIASVAIGAIGGCMGTSIRYQKKINNKDEL